MRSLSNLLGLNYLHSSKEDFLKYSGRKSYQQGKSFRSFYKTLKIWPMKYLEDIFRYLDGEMTGEEKQRFVQEIANNKSLNQSKLLIEEIDKLIADEQVFEFKEKLKTNQELYHSIIAANYVIGTESETISYGHSHIRLKHIAAAVITFLMVVSTVLFNFSKPSNEKIFASYYQPYKINNTFSRTTKSNNVDKLIDAAAHLYDKSNYEGAIAKCEQIIRTDAKNAAAHFFTGISFIELRNYDKAIDNLSFVLSQNDIFYSKQAEWQLALCYLETNQIKQATSLLTDIAKKNKYYQQKATNLLRTIK